MVLVPGGVLAIDPDTGDIIGAVGISGDRGENDEACAVAGSRPRASRPSRAAVSGVALLAVLMIIVDGFSTVIFPYQSGPILGGLA
jgi:hypothetical protein